MVTGYGRAGKGPGHGCGQTKTNDGEGGGRNNAAAVFRNYYWYYYAAVASGLEHCKQDCFWLERKTVLKYRGVIISERKLRYRF